MLCKVKIHTEHLNTLYCFLNVNTGGTLNGHWSLKG